LTEPSGSTTYPVWGAPPQPIPEEPQRSSLNGSMLLMVVMFGWLLVVFGAGALVGRNDPNIEVPVPVAHGVVVMPADGWYSAAKIWDVGEEGIALQSNGIGVAFWAKEYRGTNDELLADELAGLRADYDSFRVWPAQAVTVAHDLPALMVYFSGISEWGLEENELVVMSYRGIGVVMLAEASAGQLAWVQDDIDNMLASLVVPR
jgi:hypothetical protein